jgi:hypothetical protein
MTRKLLVVGALLALILVMGSPLLAQDARAVLRAAETAMGAANVKGPAQGWAVPASGGGNQTSPLSLLTNVSERSSPSRIRSAAQNRRALDRSGPFWGRFQI